LYSQYPLSVLLPILIVVYLFVGISTGAKSLTSTMADSYTFTNLGPLTTTFTPPESCATPMFRAETVYDGVLSWGGQCTTGSTVLADFFAVPDGDCYPSTHTWHTVRCGSHPQSRLCMPRRLGRRRYLRPTRGRRPSQQRVECLGEYAVELDEGRGDHICVLP
jgi:hypothetical protein